MHYIGLHMQPYILNLSSLLLSQCVTLRTSWPDCLRDTFSSSLPPEETMMTNKNKEQASLSYRLKGTSNNCLRPLRDLKRADARRKPKTKAGCPWRGLQRSRCTLQAVPFGAFRLARIQRCDFSTGNQPAFKAAPWLRTSLKARGRKQLLEVPLTK